MRAERKRSPSIAELGKSCTLFEKTMATLLRRAMQPLGLPELFARQHGQLQQHKDSKVQANMV